MKGAKQALGVETLPPHDTTKSLDSGKPEERPQNPAPNVDANINAPALHPVSASEAQQPGPPLHPTDANEEIQQGHLKRNDPATTHEKAAKTEGHAGHHHRRERSRSGSRDARRQSNLRSRSRSRGRRDRSRSRSPRHHHHDHHRHHHHHNGDHRNHRGEGKEKEEGRGHRRGRSPAAGGGGTRAERDHHHHHHHHEHRRKSSRSRSRSRDDRHHRKRSRSRSRSREHHHRHEKPLSIKTDRVAVADAATATDPLAMDATIDAIDNNTEAGVSISPAPTPTKLIVRHESTLVALRPSASPRSFPLSAFELAAEALKTPIPVSTFHEKRTLGPLVFGASQAKGMRPYMEDRHIIEEPLLPRGSSGAPIPDNTPRSFAAVYDGHNGTLAADHAADRLHFILAAEPAFRTCTGEGPPAAIHREVERITASLAHAFEATDKEILHRCRTENGRGGATGVVILRIGEMLYAAHCGDSRAVLCRSGEPLRLTEDHKPNLPRERKRVEDLGGRVDFARCWRVIVDPGGGRPASGLAVSRALGDLDFKQPLHLVTATPDVMSERLTEEDSFVILASDGLWDVMTDKRACEIVQTKIATAMADDASGKKVDEKTSASLVATLAAQALVQSALNAGTMDNVTAVVGLLKWS